MQKFEWSVIVTLLVMFGLSPAITLAEDTQLCGDTSTKTGKAYKVNGSKINVRTGPGTNFSKIVNQKATSAFKTTHYITIDNSVTIYEECSQGKWSNIRVTDPEWLSDSHQGWVASKFLRGKKIDVSGKEVFTEADFLFDKNTKRYKDIIISGVNKIHRENSKCKDIRTSSAYISSSKGSKSDPVFFVTCGQGRNSFNVFFSKSDVIANKKFRAKKHISKSRAINICEKYAKSKANHPSSVNFSRILDLSSNETANGRTRITSTFLAKNSFNLEVKQHISCLFNSKGLIEANISETQ